MKAHGSNVRLKAFEKFKPYYVRKLKEGNTYACKYHVKMIELQDGFNNMQGESKGIHGKHCICEYDVCCSSTLGMCKAISTTFQDLIDMWTSLLCPLGHSTFHNLACLKGECEDCGIDMLVIYHGEEDKRSVKMML
jgi:hypothetical protein